MKKLIALATLLASSASFAGTLTVTDGTAGEIAGTKGVRHILAVTGSENFYVIEDFTFELSKGVGLGFIQDDTAAAAQGSVVKGTGNLYGMSSAGGGARYCGFQDDAGTLGGVTIADACAGVDNDS